jgi:hypothetical protein
MARRPSPATRFPGTRWVSSASARSAAWWPMPRSSWACTWYGYDPEITVDAAWSLPSQVRRANSLGEVLKSCNFITLHVPLVDATRKMINAASIEQMKHGAVLLNFSREGVVRRGRAVLAAWRPRSWAAMSATSPVRTSMPIRMSIALPHLGASTREAEENCAIMVADQVRDYLLDGNIVNSVNFPNVVDAAGVGLPAGDRQRQRAEHGRPDFDGHGRGQAQHPQHDEQVEKGPGLHPGGCRQQGERKRWSTRSHRSRECWPFGICRRRT